MKKIIYLSVLFFFTSCVSNPKSQFIKNEIVTITLDKNENELGFSGGLVLMNIIPNAIGWVSKTIKSEIDKEAKKYTAIYTATKVDDSFYTDINPKTNEVNFNYKGIKIIREIIKNNKKEVVSQMDLKFIFSKNKKFISVKPDYLLIKKTKAKLKKNDNNLDVEVNVKINSFWIKNKKEYKKEEIANITFTLKNIILGKEYFDGNKEINSQSDWFPPIPISSNEEGNLIGSGNFKIIVTITEIDDYGEKVKKINTTINNFKDILLELAKENN